MSLVKALIETIVPGTGLAEAQQAGRRLLVASMFAAFGLVAGIAAIGCLLAGLWIALLPWAGPEGAPLIIGGLLAAVTVCAVLAGRSQLSPSTTVPVPLAPVLPDSRTPRVTSATALVAIELVSRVILGLLQGPGSRGAPR